MFFFMGYSHVKFYYYSCRLFGCLLVALVLACAEDRVGHEVAVDAHLFIVVGPEDGVHLLEEIADKALVDVFAV